MAHVLCNCEGCSQLLAGNQSRRMESSPPRKRARTLEMAHVSCLVASQQRSVFRSPEKPVSTASSRSTDTPLDTTVVEETPHSLDDLFSQELIEEDAVIQSSLPRYLSHVYGSSTTSSTISYGAPLTAAKSCGLAGTTATLAGTTANRTAELCSPAIAESQGFTVTGDSSAVLATVNERAGEKGESPLVATMLSRDNTPDDPTEVERVKQLGGQVKVGRKGVLRVVWDVSLRTASSSDTLSSVKSENSVDTEISPPLFDSPDSQSPTHANHPPASPLTSGSATVDSSKTLHEVSLAHTVLLNHGETNKPDSLLPVPAKEKTTGGVELIQNRTSKKRRSRAVVEKAQYTCPPLCVSLAQCTAMRPDSLVSVLAIVLQVDAVMEVACKKGSLAGSTVPMASLLLADPTRPCVKLLLWREAACWVERIVAGDIIFLESIRLKKWQCETVGHTIMYSKLLNLHQPKKTLPPKFQEKVPVDSLQGLMEWGKARHGYLFRGNQPLPTSQRAVHFRTSEKLGTESVVHFRAKLTTIVSERVILFSDRPGKEVFIYLLSSSRVGGAWYRELREGVGEVWELHYLAVSLENTQGGCSLQLTSRSRLRRLPADSSDALTILQCFPSSSQYSSVSSVDSIATLLKLKSSGIWRCRGKATEFNFQLPAGSVLSLGSLSELCGVELVSRLLEAVYVGCEACTKPLTQDENQVYCLCGDCKARTPGGHFSSAYCYRPLIVTLRDCSTTLEAFANQVVVSKLLGGVEAAELFRTSIAQDEPKSETVREAVERLLSSGEGDWWTLNTVFAVDEFSFVESLTISLVDWTPSSV